MTTGTPTFSRYQKVIIFDNLVLIKKYILIAGDFDGNTLLSNASSVDELFKVLKGSSGTIFGLFHGKS